jgi:tetratricopeptide (TPR) repeat protein
VTVLPSPARVIVSSVAGACVIVGAWLYATWPDNSIGLYFHERRNREENIRALESRIAREADTHAKRFFGAWLAEERGDLDGAIHGFLSLRDAVSPDSPLHLRSALRLGLAYGLKGQLDQELAVYQGLMEKYPGPSRLSQATHFLRRGDKGQARRLLDEALGQDDRDGSLGPDREFALSLRSGLGPFPPGTSSGSP